MTEQTKQVHPVVQFKGNLNRMIEAKELALPSNVSADAFRNAAIVAVQDNPTILTCDTASVMKSLRTLAAAGLVPDGREAAVVPFMGKAQAMPMVFGLIKMARRSGDVSDIRAHIVYQAELDQGLFTYVVGDEERLEHKPILFAEKGPAVAAYAIARLKDGTIVREFMDAGQIDKVRRSSPQQKKSATPNGIWQQWTDEMWKKTVIRRLCKRLDLSAEDMRRMMIEDEATEPAKDITPPKETLAQRIMAETPVHPTAEKEPEPEVEDAQVLPAEFDEDAVDPMTDEYDEGFKAHEGGKAEDACPHEVGTFEWNNWIGGYRFRASKSDRDD